MAITWGGNGTLRVGIEVWTDGYDTWTPSINVYIALYVGSDNYNYSDNQTLTLSGSVGAQYNFFNDLPRTPGAIKHVATYTIGGQGQSYGGGPDYYFEARISGAFNGAAPAVGVNFRLPPRPPRAPAPPSYGPGWSSITATSAYLAWGGTSDAGGSGLIEDELQVSLNSAFTAMVHDSIQGGSARGVGALAPGTRYWSRARVRNGVGWSGWSATTSDVTASFATGAPSVSGIGPDVATINWAAPPGGTPVGYEIQWAKDAGFTSGLQSFESGTWSTSRKLTALAPATRYHTRVRSKTSTGYGAWSASTPFDTLSGAKIRRNGVWVDAPVYVRIGGQWKVAKVHKRVNGAWVL